MSRFTRTRTLIGAAAAALAALGVFVSTGVASDSSSQATLINHSVKFHGLRAHSAAGGYDYLVSAKFTITAGHAGGGTLKCPTSFPHPIGGQFASSSPEVVLSASYKNGATGWVTGLSNFGSSSATVQIGIVCA